jgi:hypothetical protein
MLLDKEGAHFLIIILIPGNAKCWLPSLHIQLWIKKCIALVVLESLRRRKAMLASYNCYSIKASWSHILRS